MLPPLKQLKKWRLACIKSDLDLIFPNESGKPLSALNMFNRKFIPTLEKAGLKKIRFHDLLMKEVNQEAAVKLGACPRIGWRPVLPKNTLEILGTEMFLGQNHFAI